MIAIIDYDAGNTFNVQKALAYIGLDAVLTADPEVILNADGVLLPGVGAYASAVAVLKERGLVDVIHEVVKREIPLLGICLGMQLMTKFSTEGNVATLGLMNGQTNLIPDSGLPLPHMGWNKVRYMPDHPLFAGIEQDSHFYFVHSYAVQPNENTIATSCYGVDFSAAIANKNFYGVQFHPERSGKNGALLLKNFVEKVK